MMQLLKRILFYADERQEAEIRHKSFPPELEIVFSRSFPSEKEIDRFDIFFLLMEENALLPLADSAGNQTFKNRKYTLQHRDFKEKTVVINSTIITLSEAGLPGNFSRINGWPGFLQRDVWEIAAEDTISITALFDMLRWKIFRVKDEPGLVAARVLSMIINEGYCALKENISTRDEIDLAMKLGTNYPFGPFEWAKKIGIELIFDLLTSLSQKDNSYLPYFDREGSIS